MEVDPCRPLPKTGKLREKMSPTLKPCNSRLVCDFQKILQISLILYFCSCIWTSESSLLRRLFQPLHLCVSLLLLLGRKVFMLSFFFDMCLSLVRVGVKNVKDIQSKKNTNIYENIMFFKVCIKMCETAAPIRN